jgi:protein TonB
LGKTQGTVSLHVLVETDGTSRDVEVLSGDPLLAEAAVKAVCQWRYTPMLICGQPVEVEATINLGFQWKNP